MFKKPFSFSGYIHRTEFALTLLILIPLSGVLSSIILATNNSHHSKLAVVLAIPTAIFVYWLLWAQGAKRCHDLGHSGWFQIIPFYFLVMLFQSSRFVDNTDQQEPATRHGVVDEPVKRVIKKRTDSEQDNIDALYALLVSVIVVAIYLFFPFSS